MLRFNEMQQAMKKTAKSKKMRARIGGATAGISVLAIAIVLYLVVAIGRNVGSGK